MDWFPVCAGDIEEGQLEEEDVEQDEQLEPTSVVSTTTTLTESHPHTSSTLVGTSGPTVTTVSSISEQVSSVIVAGGDKDEGDPPPAKRKPQPIVWSQPSSCKGCHNYSIYVPFLNTSISVATLHITILHSLM